ncbi:MAG: zinc carboxypeptidase [Chitinophagaceae bacterium]|nr:MAG: zinc carboxypeptidase [Chitinophagaceae bacterium]
MLFFTACLAALFSMAQVKSPEAFLGYKIGSRYTPHFQVVNYFKHVAEAMPSMVKLQQYGETNEKRPLYLSFVSSAENIGNLENIRLNNMRLANLAKDKMAPTEDAPAIVWLSYNVHGNETSSSEAAMLTIYALVDPQNTTTKGWLKNTLVVIDPCLNPDGRDRYVNWFNSVVGQQSNPLLIAREHREPWPGGRSNHYNFDLNRDWAWQTQLESKQRIAQYLQWMPYVHVDFHEQGVNQPYYFAPAAQPYHETISKWQRDFQVTIGKNHASYFDKNNWLYFTKEIFDLFYPSYGDTYPIYNGSIGMTYEQGGGPAAGIAVETDEGDTLTLYDRAIHHHTTGMSTIEVASQNAGKLVKEFRQFFNEASRGAVGTYKSYVIKYDAAAEGRMRALLELLDKNGIQYGTASGNGKGYNYHTKKDESFTIAANDIVISAAQPRAVMVKVLFEPESKLVDSATYDITAWALPYTYGLKAFASTQAISVGGPKPLADFVNNTIADAYAYAIPWQSAAGASAATQLLQNGVRLRFSETAFETGGNRFGNGAVIVTKKGNEKFGSALWKMVADVCNERKVKTYPVQSGMVDKGFDFGSSYVRPMKAPRVMLLTGEGVSSTAAGEIWHFFDTELKYPITLINANDFGRINLSNFDVIIMPDGRYKMLSDKEQSKQLEQWISGGGRVVALESAVAQLAKQEWSNLKSQNADEDSNKNKDPYAALLNFSDRERHNIAGTTPGSIFKVDVDNSHPLMFGYPNYYYTLKMDGAVYEFMKEGGWNVGTIKKENQLAGFVGYKLNPKLKDGLLFGVQELGNGTVTYLADNVVFRNFWENGKLMLCNAVFMVGQ